MNQKKYAVNETVKSYEPGSQERHDIQEKYDEMANQSIDIPIIINGKEYRTEEIGECIMPHDHQNIIEKNINELPVFITYLNLPILPQTKNPTNVGLDD